MKQNANSLCHVHGKKPDKISEICFPKDCKVRVELCITSEIRLGENLGRDVRQFPLLAGFCTSSNDKGWLVGNESYLCIFLQPFVKSGLYLFLLVYTSLLSEFSVVTNTKRMKYTFWPKKHFPAALHVSWNVSLLGFVSFGWVGLFGFFIQSMQSIFKINYSVKCFATT